MEEGIDRPKTGKVGSLPPPRVTVPAGGHSGWLRETHREIGTRSREPARGLPALIYSQCRVFCVSNRTSLLRGDRLYRDVVQVVISHSSEVTAGGRDVVWLGRVGSPRNSDQGECPASRVD